MKTKLFGLTVAATLAFAAPAKAADVICYNCPPQWADWGSQLKAIQSKLGITVPPDNKNSGQAIAALIAEKANPVADVTYLGGIASDQAKSAGILSPYKPKNWDKIPADLKDPEGYWFTIHSGTLGLFVNKQALGGSRCRRAGPICRSPNTRAWSAISIPPRPRSASSA